MKTNVKSKPDRQPQNSRTDRQPGRPTKYRPEFCNTLVRDMAKGFTLTAWAGSIGVSRETVYEWERTQSEFSDAVARGRAARQRYWETRLMDTKAGAAVSGIVFALRNCCREDWSDRREIEHAMMEVDKPIEQMSREELRQIAVARGLLPSNSPL